MKSDEASQMTGTRKSYLRIVKFWRLYRKNRAAVLGLVVVTGLSILALGAPLVTSFEPLRLVARPFQSPSSQHLMGTDHMGRDLFTDVLYGARTSLQIGFLAATTSVLIGTIVGALAGYYGSYKDEILMRITEVFQVVPRLFLALAAVAIVGPTVWNVIWVIGLTSWPTTARLVRAEFLSLRERPFVEASKGLGAGDIQVIWGEIFPNATSSIVVNSSFEVARAIVLEAGLSFLGLGDANVASWGRTLQEAQSYLQRAWWTSLFPGLFIALTVLGLNLIGDGLNDALNPRLRER